MSASDARGQRLLPWISGGDELEEILKARIRHHREKGASEDTIRKERQVFKILRELGTRTSDDLVSTDTVCQFKEHCAGQGWGDRWRNTLHGTFFATVRFECKRRGHPAPPGLERRKPARRPRRHRFSPEAHARVAYRLEFVEGDSRASQRLWMLMRIVSEMGIPMVATLRLRPADISEFFDGQRWVKYHPRKSIEPRYAPIPACLRPAIQGWLEYCEKHGHEWLFACPKVPSRPWSKVDACRALAEACDRTGIAPITFDELRRHDATRDDARADSPASTTAEDGIDFDDLADQLERIHGGRFKSADLVRFMKGRDSASFDEIAEGIHDGERQTDQAYRVLASRTSNDLRYELRSKLRFLTTGDSIIRKDWP